MNIKKCSLKVMCAALAGTMFVSTLLPAFATEAIVTETPMDENVGGGVETDWTIEEEKFQDVDVTYKQSASYLVTIPKTIALGMNKQAAYSVKVSGDIDTNQRVYVAPVDGITDTENIDFYMKDQTADSKKADVVATVTQNKFYWNSEEVTAGYEETNNSVSAPQLTAGTWKGTFQVEINLQTMAEQEHVHNYVDGKCECGAVDPDHTHNYEDGTCTICGKEQDSYETAPENEYSRWNYTLDGENDIITLNYYIGTYTGTEVIVYANYVIDGKTYKTQIKSNDENATNRTPYMFNNEFNYDQYIETIKFSDDIDMSNVTNMRSMFYGCGRLTDIDFGANFDTSNVTNMSYMFGSCDALINLDLSSFDTSNVTDMRNMFSNCWKLEDLDLSSFDTSKVKDMSFMFYQCLVLKTIYVTEGKWSTELAESTQIEDGYGTHNGIYEMFKSCGTSSVTYK